MNQITTPKYYNKDISIYSFCESYKLNSYEFDAVKRICRARKKGEFQSDILKTINVLKIYLEEYKKYEEVEVKPPRVYALYTTNPQE